MPWPWCVQTLDKDMKMLLKTITAHFKNLRCILVSPLPRGYTWDAEGMGGILPMDSQPQLLGANMEVSSRHSCVACLAAVLACPASLPGCRLRPSRRLLSRHESASRLRCWSPWGSG